ncbi:MAG: DUF3047 domain-containing protein [Syntrophaceae bacterium]|nr:DUF3047 domain-containing protein [Syntrophaceae bacterium]
MRVLQISLAGMAVWGMTAFTLPCPASDQGVRILEVGKFSAAQAGSGFPGGWKPLTFKNIDKHTVYSLVKDGDKVVVKAVSQASASGLIREIKIDPLEFPILEWRWKVEKVLKKGDVRRKEGDDYPARVYVTFEYDPQKLSFLDRTKYGLVKAFYGQYPPLAALNYIWERQTSIGTVIPNPFTDRAMMIVVQSGPDRVNQWITEERNVLEDYWKAFGEDPPMINGVAIMTDTDNTGESAVAYYGDIFFKKKSP